MIGSSLAHYRILSPLGTGSMGEVFLARDTRLERNLAAVTTRTGLEYRLGTVELRGAGRWQQVLSGGAGFYLTCNFGVSLFFIPELLAFLGKPTSHQTGAVK